jgi:hypothetical protein
MTVRQKRVLRRLDGSGAYPGVGIVELIDDFEGRGRDERNGARCGTCHRYACNQTFDRHWESSSVQKATNGPLPTFCFANAILN